MQRRTLIWMIGTAFALSGACVIEATGGKSPDPDGRDARGLADGGGAGGTGGSAGAGGAGGAGGGGAGQDTLPADAPEADAPRGFSFFRISQAKVVQTSGSNLGFGGNLGGLAGADRICQTVAESAGGAGKTWRAFLSTFAGPVHAIERIGPGPWHDRNGRLVARDIQGLIAGPRPMGDPHIIDDLPDENGAGRVPGVDDHDILTASDSKGRLRADSQADTCNDWTSAAVLKQGSWGGPLCGHYWPRSASSGNQWLSDHRCGGCEAGINTNPDMMGGNCVGCGGGYGGWYCFATTP